MSAENVKLVEQIYASMQSGDRSMMTTLFDPEIEIYQSEELAWGGHYKGYAGVAQFLERLYGNVDSEVETIRLIDAGDTVVQIGFTRGTAKSTGKRFDVPEVHVWKIRDGKVISFRPFIDNPTMLAAFTVP